MDGTWYGHHLVEFWDQDAQAVARAAAREGAEVVLGAVTLDYVTISGDHRDEGEIDVAL